MAAVATGRAKDLSFVLDRLTGRHPAWRHAHMIDPHRIGMAGHSIGGNATASTMAADHRVRAGVDMDGTFFDPIPMRRTRRQTVPDARHRLRPPSRR